jgi:HlyD family secretion protein
VPLLAEQAEAWSQLVAEGFAGRLQAQERVRLHLEGARELEAATASADGARAAAAQARQRLAQRESEHRQQLLTARAEVQADLDRLVAELRKQDVRRELLVLHAPRAGVVKDIATHSIGAVVQPGTVLLSLVPTDAPLEAEVHVSDHDAGFVREGQAVHVKVGAFAFQRYGMVGGTVRHVGPDAIDPRGTGGDADAPPGGYRAFIALDREALDHEGRRLPLVAGMLVAAEVQLGTRSVLDYVLSPVAKTAMEAGRER